MQQHTPLCPIPTLPSARHGCSTLGAIHQCTCFTGPGVAGSCSQAAGVLEQYEIEALASGTNRGIHPSEDYAYATYSVAGQIGWVGYDTTGAWGDAPPTVGHGIATPPAAAVCAASSASRGRPQLERGFLKP